MIPNRILPRLLLGFLLLSPLPLGGLAWLYVQAFERTLTATMLETLSSIADKKALQIDTYLEERVTDGKLLALSPLTREALHALSPTDGGMPARNVRRYRDYFQAALDAVGHWDVLLVDTAGNVVFTVRHEADLGSNLNTGPLKDGPLAVAHREALILVGTRITQARRYAPSGERPAIFVVTPVLDDGRVIGTLALQLDLDRFTHVTADATGLGETGETVLAQLDNEEAFYVGPLRHIDDAAFRYRVPLDQAAAPMRAALRGGHDSGRTRDYVGIEILAAWRHLPALRWGMVVKMDVSEALAPAAALRSYTYSALALLLLAAAIAAWLFGRALVTPIRQLTLATRRIATGDLHQRAEAQGCSEFRELAESFNQMADRLAEEQETLERRVAERTRELEESEATLQRAQAMAHIGSWHLDLSGNGLTWSDETYRIFAIPIGTPLSYELFLGFVHPEDRTAVDQAWQAALAGAPYDITHRILIDDEVRWVREQAELSFDAAGRLASGIGTVHDITASKRSEAEYRTMIATTMDGFWVVDMQGRFIDVNEAYCIMSGYRRDELLAMSVPDVEAIERPEETRAHIEKILHEGRDRFESRHRRKSGETFDVEISVNYLAMDGGRMIVFSRDITERKRAEVALLEAKQAAEAASRAKSEFLANMSHEIRTPMNAILGLTQLVLETELTPRQEDYLRKAFASSRALLNILNDILDYSKIEAGRMSIEPTAMSVEDTLSEVADLFGAQIQEKGLALYLDIAPDVPTAVLGDRLRLTQVLNNLLSNAIKFTERAEICIKAEVAARSDHAVTLRFAVRDTGVGLSKTQTDQLFRPFTQADGSITRRYGGTGLGLAISQRLVDLMGGELNVSSREGEGATFTFTIRTEETQAAAVAGPRRLAPMRVLIVDDQDTERQILSRLLKSWDAETDSLATGESVLAYVEAAQHTTHPIDAVLLDWRLPGMNGLDVARQLEQAVDDGRIRHPLLVVMVTAYDKEDLMNEAGTLPLDGVLTKPVTPSPLYDTLCKARGLHPTVADVPTDASAAERLDGLRVLLVEDNLINREMAAEMLRRRGAEVTLAEDGAEAVAWVERAPFDAVLMDLHMPVMDGFEATARILASPQSRALPVVAMTAAVMAEDRNRCMAAGMQGFLPKPVDAGELVRCLRQVLRLPASSDRGTSENAAAAMPASMLNLDEALARMDDDHALLLQLLRSFAEHQPDAGTRLQALLQSGDRNGAARLLHTLKGLAGNIGAATLAQTAAAFEQVLRDPDANGSFAALAERFEHELAATLEAVPAAIARLAPDDADRPPAAAPVDPATVAAAVTELKQYLERHEVISDDLRQTLEDIARRGPEASAFVQLLQRIDRFDHAGALRRLAELRVHA